ncbi:hypothetical protein KIH87_10080 [Paraneptunicella aestuarii]|uniref:hypothetical protein n=1 Tax=Paraneptunicella aestuarii TaxID=2831148 RepID=UPI001E51C8DB|nr:hypothetical protein [Paraneptunicella aestuarii]UAA37100.1 hypothetical protein KIH87_10080 [Paraneptunicella aestuarii]
MTVADNRLGRNPVRLIGINAPFEPAIQFGREYGSATDPRSAVNAAWGIEYNGRATDEGASIKEPLPAREQSILAHQLSPHLQSQLRGGLRPIENKGRNHFQPRPELDSVHLGAAIATQPKPSSTVSPVVHTLGGMVLRTVRGDYNFQL